MSALRTALILILAGGSATAFAEQITCESRQSGPEACGTIQPGSSVRLVRQLGATPCVEGRNWGTGAAHDSLWVSQGCRAVFDVQPQDDQAAAGPGDDRSGGDDRAMRTDRDADQADDPYAASRDDRMSRRDDRMPARDDTARDDAQSDENGADEGADQDEGGSSDERTPADTRRDARDEDTQVAGAGRTHAVARQACIDEAAAGQSFGPEDVTATDVRWIGRGLLVVELETPDGDLTCTVDRDGNVRSVDR